MVKEIEKAGFPIVQMANLVPVAKTVGYNGRINSYKECLTLSKKIGYNLRKQYGGF